MGCVMALREDTPRKLVRSCIFEKLNENWGLMESIQKSIEKVVIRTVENDSK